jgi:hypothetical protein
MVGLDYFSEPTSSSQQSDDSIKTLKSKNHGCQIKSTMSQQSDSSDITFYSGISSGSHKSQFKMDPPLSPKKESKGKRKLDELDEDDDRIQEFWGRFFDKFNSDDYEVATGFLVIKKKKNKN